MGQDKKSPSQEYLDKVSPMGNALTAEESAHLRKLLIAEGEIDIYHSDPDDFLEPGDEEKLPPELKQALAELRADKQPVVRKTGNAIKP
ncbi:MAG: hypothetical protein HYS17_11775 [Micavibrio aeruginosavorus]|uniref:Uncharacterized protein n=1 Tax=Micavibrio aeruginosavorus TaxID=349221 RepID=A0A7T5R274_9BACT|nr:MAG: hypothetical protein HYS17_11775 [Micavibrio aeruginosavorus]